MVSVDTVWFKSWQIHFIQWFLQQILHHQSEYSTQKLYTGIQLYLGSCESNSLKIKQEDQGFPTQLYVLEPSSKLKNENKTSRCVISLKTWKYLS